MSDQTHSLLPVRLLWKLATLLLTAGLVAQAWQFDMPSSGFATMTHYDLPSGYVASCGCVGDATYYPTVALNRLAYGSNTSFGPACGLCFQLRLVSTPLARPPPPPGQPGWGDGIYYPLQQVESGHTPSLVVKVVDLCPGIGGPWCNATRYDNGTEQGNSLGMMVHFDLAWPSKAISKTFFPGNHDYGAWNITYEAVSCQQWAGYKNPAALGSDWSQQTSACCPNNPPPSGNTNATCPPYWQTVGLNAAIAPNTSNPLSKGKRWHPNQAVNLSPPSTALSSALGLWPWIKAKVAVESRFKPRLATFPLPDMVDELDDRQTSIDWTNALSLSLPPLLASVAMF